MPHPLDGSYRRGSDGAITVGVGPRGNRTELNSHNSN